MMAPAATAAASGAKAGAIDAASLFAADKAASTEAQVALAATAKKDGVNALAGLSDAVVKVSQSAMVETALALFFERHELNSG